MDHPAGRDAEPGQAVEHGPGRIARRGRQLEHREPVVGVPQDAIGERAAGIDAHNSHHAPFAPLRRAAPARP